MMLKRSGALRKTGVRPGQLGPAGERLIALGEQALVGVAVSRSSVGGGPGSMSSWGAYGSERHQLDPVPHRAADEAARRVPVLRPRLGVQASFAQRAERAVVVVDDHRDMALRRDDRLVDEQQMHLCAGALDPRRSLRERGRRRDVLEPEQGPKARAGVGVRRPDLDRDVLDHEPLTWTTLSAWIARWRGELRAIGSFASGSASR